MSKKCTPFYREAHFEVKMLKTPGVWTTFGRSDVVSRGRRNSARRPSKMEPMRFAIFPLHLSKVLRLPRKSDARSYEVLHLSCKIISANLKI